MFAPDAMFYGFGCFFAGVVVLILIPMLLHTALFGGVFYTILKQIQQRSLQAGSHKCAHCGTMRTGVQAACPSCGAPFDASPSPTV
ncbi:MAG TPA: hypothetical protein VM165_10850 [Planctomycetaceae bacterium]|nr:hypothetical protein [Planctomycetaceae bacterium]